MPCTLAQAAFKSEADAKLLEQLLDGRTSAFARAAEPSEYTLWCLPELSFGGTQPTPCKFCGRRGFLSTVGIASREYATPDGIGLLFGQRVRCNHVDASGKKCGEFKSWDVEARVRSVPYGPHLCVALLPLRRIVLRGKQSSHPPAS